MIIRLDINGAVSSATPVIAFNGSDNKIYTMGNGQSKLNIYDIQTATWTVSSDTTATNAPSLAYDSLRRKIYVLGNDDVLKTYDISNNTWTSASTGFDFNNVTMTYDAINDRVYAYGQGNTTLRSYDPNTVTWSNITTSGTSVIAPSIVYSPLVNSIFIFRNNSTSFQRYNLSTGGLFNLTGAPIVSGNPAVTYDNNHDRIYLKGNDSNLYVYDVSSNTWRTELATPALNDPGLTYDYNNNQIYALGASSNLLRRYTDCIIQLNNMLPAQNPVCPNNVLDVFFDTTSVNQTDILSVTVTFLGSDMTSDMQTGTNLSVRITTPGNIGDYPLSLKIVRNADGICPAVSDTKTTIIRVRDIVPPTFVWTWIKGPNFVNQNGIYTGPSDQTVPGARQGSATWIGSDGQLYLFGGDRNFNPRVFFNDLWTYNPQTSNWRFIKGSSNSNDLGVYIGTSDALMPRNRSFPGFTQTADGYFYLFGGNNTINLSTAGLLNDLWRYDSTLNRWTWLKGASDANRSGVYGQQGVPDPSNTPGARQACHMWAGPNNRVYLFGGKGRNDLWVYTPSDNNWTWIHGSDGVNQTPIYGTINVPDPANTPGARSSSMIWTGPDGNFYLFGGQDQNDNLFNDLWMYDPIINMWTWIKGPSTINSSGTYGNLNESAASNVPPGRVLGTAWVGIDNKLYLFGGATATADLNDLWTFDLQTQNWTWIKGANTANPKGSYGVKGITTASNNISGRDSMMSWVGKDGKYYVFGGFDASGNRINDLWRGDYAIQVLHFDAIQPLCLGVSDFTINFSLTSTTPSDLIRATLTYGNTIISSDYTTDGLNTFTFPAPQIASDYIMTLGIQSLKTFACAVSQSIVKVIDVKLFDLQTAIACANQFFALPVYTAVTNGGNAYITTVINGLTSVNNITPGNGVLNIKAPGIGSDYIMTVTLQDAITHTCTDMKTVLVKVTNIKATNLAAGYACTNNFFDVSFDITLQNGGVAKTVLTWNGSDYTSDFTPGTGRSFRVQAPAIAGTYPMTLKVQDSINTSCSDVKSISVIVNQFTQLTTGWTLSVSDGLSATANLLYTTIDGQSVLVVASRGNNTVKFFKRVGGVWSDMGASWNITSDINNSRGLLFATIDCKQILGVGNLNTAANNINFFERKNNTWVRQSDWALSVGAPENILYTNIAGKDVLVVADRNTPTNPTDLNGKIRFYERSAGTWNELVSGWRLTSSDKIDVPIGLNYTKIDGSDVLIVANRGTTAPNPAIRFYRRGISNWSEISDWAIPTNSPINGITYTKIGGLNVLIAGENNGTNVRFYQRTGAQLTTGWTLTNANGINAPVGIMHTVIDGQDVVVIGNQGNNTVGFFQVCDGCFINIQGLSTNPLCPCANQPFTVNWVVGTANGLDQHRAIISVSDQTIISDYPNNAGSATFLPKTVGGNYPLTLTVQDKLFSDCTDARSMTLTVNQFNELTTGWTLTDANGLNSPAYTLNTVIDGISVLGVSNAGNGSIRFYKRVSGAWSDMGPSWIISNAALVSPREMLFTTIDCKNVLAVTDFKNNVTSGQVLFFERIGGVWSFLPTWTISGFSSFFSPESIVYARISGQDVLAVADRDNNRVRFFQRSAGNWIELTTNWTLTSNVSNPAGLLYTAIDNQQVLVVTNINNSSIRFYTKSVSGWTELLTWAISARNDGGVQFGSINGKKVLAFADYHYPDSNNTTIRFFERTGGAWVERAPGWTLSGQNNNLQGLHGIELTVIDGKFVLSAVSGDINKVSFFEICSTNCVTYIEGLSTTPPCPCANQPFTVNWVVGTANGSDQHTAQIIFNNQTVSGTYPNNNGTATLTAPSVGSDYRLSILVKDSLFSGCTDTSGLTIKVIQPVLSDLSITPIVCSGMTYNLSLRNFVTNIPISAASDIVTMTITHPLGTFISDFPNNQTLRTFTFTAPTVASDYPVGISVHHKFVATDCVASDVRVLKVDKVAISDLHAGPVCVGSFFDVFFNVDVQNGGLARTTLTWNGSDYRSDFVSGTRAFHVQAPSVGSDYQAVLKVQDTLNLSCSDVKTTTIKVIKFALSDITLTPNPVCKGQPYTVSWANIVQNGGTQANVTINVNGNDHTTQQSIGGGSLLLPAIGVASDYVVTVTVADSTYSFCSDVKSKILSVQEVAVDAGLDREIVFGHSTQLGIGTPAPNVSYSWTPTTGLNDPNILNPISTPVTDGYTTYTVVASRTDVSDCVASDAVTIFACHLQLSDIQFTSLGQTGFSLSGSQSSNKNTTRIVEITYLGDTHQQVFTGNGTFMDSFSNITVIDGATITIHAYHSDNPACSDTKTAITSIQNNQGVIGFQLVGSALAFDLALSPEATAALLPPTSDIHEALDRLCDFAQTQPCHRTVGVLTITDQSDVFAPNSTIINGDHTVFIQCSDTHMIFNEIQGAFHLDISPYLSDNVDVFYSDALSTISKNMDFTGTGFAITFNNQKFVEVSACFSDFPRIGLNDYVSCSLLSADINSAITGVDQVGCVPVCYNRTSDANYVGQLIACEEQVEQYLSQNFTSYTFSDKCCVTYTGDMIADELRIDLNTCTMLMSGIHMPICSDVGIC